MRVRRVLTILPLAALALLAQDNATVVNAGRGWRYANKILARGQTIPVRSTQVELQLAAGATAGELLLECPRGLVRYACTEDCGVPTCAKQSDTLRSTKVFELPDFARYGWSEAVMRALFTREPREMAALGVRGGGNPSDAVLLMDAKGVHWGAALARVLEGRYCLRLTPLPSGPARAVTIDWDRATDAEGIAPAAGIVAGIYSLDKGMPGATGACSVESDARAAWVVIAPEAQFNRMNPGWKQQSAEIAQLERSAAGPDIAATLRHAVLASLADAPDSK
ncbi:MAG TPA: hypothetical protein VGR73_06315 [Bryobacteraceae bacterium]|nr:hypothetical protein [Bryobacteraceae bacterium]